MAGVRMLMLRWRADRGLLLLLVVVIATTAGMAGAVPRLLDTLQRQSLGAELRDSRPDQLGVAATVVAPFSLRDVPAGLRKLDLGAEDAAQAIAPPLASVLGEPVPVVDSIRYDLEPLPGDPVDPFSRKLTMRMQVDVEPLARVVAGAWPDGVVDRADVTMPPDGAAAAPDRQTLRVHEFAATATTADALGMKIGDRRLGIPDQQGPIAARAVPHPDEMVVFVLSGIVELAPIDDPAWFGDARLHRPTQFDTNTSTTLFAYGMLPPSAAGELPGVHAGQVASISWRWQLDQQALLAGDPDAVAAAALTLRTGVPLSLSEPRWTTGLDRVLAREAARRATAVEVLGLGVVAVVGVAAALLAAVGALLAGRRRDSLALIRGRGASRAQTLAASGLEAASLAVVGVAAAVALLLATVPGAGGFAAASAVAVVAVVVLVGSMAGDARRPLGVLLAERQRGRAARPARYVLEGLLVLLAAVAVAALRRRGVEVDGEADPLVVAAPALVAAAAAVVAARLVPLPLRALDLAAGRGRSLVLPLGLARAARRATGGTVVVLVVLGLGVAGLAGAVHATLVDGQARAAQERVGADVKIDAPALATLDAWEPPTAGDLVVDLSEVQGTVVTDVGAQSVDVLLVDAAGVSTLGNDGGTLPDLVWDGIGPTPVVVSAVLRPAGSPEVDDVISVLIGVQRVSARIVAVDPRVLGLDAQDGGAFVVLDRDAAFAATGVEPGSTSRLVRTSDPQAAAQSALAADADVDVLVRDEVRAALMDAPLARGVRVGFLVAAAASALATMLALVLALAAAAPERRREAGVLAAVGTSHRDIAGALLAEVLPVVFGASVAGVGLSAGIASALGPRLDLAPFTGTVDATMLGRPSLLLASMLVAGAVIVTALAAVLTLGRVDPGTILREGES